MSTSSRIVSSNLITSVAAINSITIAPITGDDIVDYNESTQLINISGQISGEYERILSITLIVDDKEYAATINTDGSYSVSIPGSELAVNNSIKVESTIVDDLENLVNLSAEREYEVSIIEPPVSPVVIITEDADDNGLIDKSELSGNIDYTVSVDPATVIGSTLNITTTYTNNGIDQTSTISVLVTDSILLNGYSGSFDDIGVPADGSSVHVDAVIIDLNNVSSTTSSDTAILDTPLDPCEDPGADAAPMYMWHLGANLTDSEGPSDHRGKTGGKYGHDIGYATGDMNDSIYIGYTGFDSHGNLIKSCWDGDFERDYEDGHALWNLETYAGHDLVHIREDQNAYTTAKLGTGNDTYYVQGKLDSELGVAQYHPEARSYIYTEECHDMVVIGGNGDGKVTGWGVDGGRIFTGSGNDNVMVYGEMDDGGVIDLGAGRVEFALDQQAASTVDTSEHTNYLTITHNLGNSIFYDFGHVFGGDASDNVDIGTYVEGTSIIDLGEGNNNIRIGDDLDGHAKVVTGSGEDTLYIGDDTEDCSTVNLGDGNNTITIASYVEDKSVIKVGSGNDVIDVAKSMVNHSEIHLGEGDNQLSFGRNILGSTVISAGAGNDELNIGHKIDGHAEVNLGAGDNMIVTGDDVDGSITLTTLGGNDKLTVGEDVEDFAIIDLGNGSNTINVVRHIEDHSTILTGNDEDTLNVGGSILNYADINLGDGNDIVIIEKTIKDSASTDLGSGDDVITIKGELMSGCLEGGDGEDTLILDYTDNSHLLNSLCHITNATTENITGIERVELKGKNVIDIRYEDLLNDVDREGALFVSGTSDSKVDLGSTNWNSDNANKAKMDDSTGGEWLLDGQSIQEGIIYNIYHNSLSSDTSNDVFIETSIVVI